MRIDLSKYGMLTACLLTTKTIRYPQIFNICFSQLHVNGLWGCWLLFVMLLGSSYCYFPRCIVLHDYKIMNRYSLLLRVVYTIYSRSGCHAWHRSSTFQSFPLFFLECVRLEKFAGASILMYLTFLQKFKKLLEFVYQNPQSIFPLMWRK